MVKNTDNFIMLPTVDFCFKELMNMEMQVASFKYWINRVLFYIGKIYTGQIREGEDYEKLQKCVHVSILDFNYFQKDDRCYRKAAICDMETGELYTDLLELHTLELRKLPPEDIAELFELELDEVLELAEEWKKEQ